MNSQPEIRIVLWPRHRSDAAGHIIGETHHWIGQPGVPATGELLRAASHDCGPNGAPIGPSVKDRLDFGIEGRANGLVSGLLFRHHRSNRRCESAIGPVSMIRQNQRETASIDQIDERP